MTDINLMCERCRSFQLVPFIKPKIFKNFIWVCNICNNQNKFMIGGNNENEK